MRFYDGKALDLTHIFPEGIFACIFPVTYNPHIIARNNLLNVTNDGICNNSK
jgi:hypothetical protein